MKQVVLHTADNAAARRYVKTQNAVQVHPPQCMGYAPGRAKDAQEQAVIARVLTKFINSFYKITNMISVNTADM